MRRNDLRELCVFGLLVAIAVGGRWSQPAWNVTPLAAASALGGFYFSRRWLAYLLPLVALLASNVLLPSYHSGPVLLAVLVALAVPVWLGRMARSIHGWRQAGMAAACGLVPATAFFVVTNFAVWACTGLYEHTLGGLAACYAAAVPFYRSMLVGDVLYVALFVACLRLEGLRAKGGAASLVRAEGIQETFVH